jgi:hypothetical protein
MSTLQVILISLFAENFVRVLNALGVNQSGSSTVNSAYAWLLTLNPIVVIILGVIVFFAGKFAKFVGIIMLVVGLILLALPYVLH